MARILQHSLDMNIFKLRGLKWFKKWKSSLIFHT